MSTHEARPHDAATAAAQEVDADIRAELDAHLAHCEDELIAEGCAPHHARELARLRFGDFDRTLRACRRQKRQGSRMLQRLHLAATVLLAAAVLWFGYQAQANTRRMAALQSEALTRAPLPLEPVIVERGDTIRLHDAFHRTELGTTREVASDGTVLLPDLGHVPLAGKTREQAEAHLMEAYAPYYDLLDLHIEVIKGR